MTALALVVAAVLVVSPAGPYTTIDEALADARPGDVIEVRGGVYGPLVVDKSVTLLGMDGAVLDGEGAGDVVRIEAPDVTLAGFEIRNSGRTLEKEHAGVTVTAPGAVVRDNTLHDVLFGIFLKGAHDSAVARNEVVGYPLDSARRGDGIRSWYSERIAVRENRVHRTRDVIFWFSNDALIEGNVVSGGRYGLHFMYDDGLVVRGNEVYDNSVGVFLMYSSNVLVEDNLLRDSTGPSGYGLGLKEIANLEVRDNVLVRNRIGVSFDTVPHGVEAYAHVRDNLLALNHVGMSFQPSTERVELLGNTFDANGAVLEVRGGGDLRGNTWNDERGNYWSGYAGYDADGDGVGDLAYEPRSLFASLRDEHPALGLFNHSPAAGAVDFAARAVPALAPGPQVVDEAPLMRPSAPAWFDTGAARSPAWLLASAALGVTLAGIGATLGRAGVRARRRPAAAEADAAAGGDAVRVRGLTKRYGRHTVLDRFDLDVRPGESVVLWGENGAGKTTALRAMLGLVRADGEVAVFGRRLDRDGRALRRLVGHVPQDPELPDIPLRELVQLIEGLRAAEPGEGMRRATLLGLEEHLAKRPSELSGGLRQRLALALAMVGEPPVLLLDEPTANLDAASRQSIVNVLRALRDAGTALVMTTHRVDEAVELGHRVVTLAAGRTVADEPVERFAERIAGGARLLLRVAPDDVEAASDALERVGAAVDVQGGWLAVERCAPHRAMRALWEAGVAVEASVPGKTT